MLQISIECTIISIKIMGFGIDIKCVAISVSDELIMANIRIENIFINRKKYWYQYLRYLH